MANKAGRYSYNIKFAELRIENCHPFSATAVETIVNSLHEQNSLKVLGLVST